MSTTISTSTHRLAALLAVERDANERYRLACHVLDQVVALSDARGAAYETAVARQDDALRSLVSAQVDVDAALHALSGVRDRVSA